MQTVTPTATPKAPGALWTPTVGAEAKRVTKKTLNDAGARQRVVQEASGVLARCTPPGHHASRTGLVIGYVQSGKTLSFTTVSALARDNGYRLVIAIAGSSTPLFRQSAERLDRDLGPMDFESGWKLVRSDNLSSRKITDAVKDVRSTLEDWGRHNVPKDEQRSILIVVMKNGTHLKRVISLLEKLGPSLRDVPALVIDDEADQASLNTKVNRSAESATYSRMLEIRDLLPSHTYLQYTATPQGPLLIDIVDILSPHFARVLTPGSAYTGGKTFFNGEGRYVSPIPMDEVPPADVDEFDGPPSSLLDVLAVFFVGVVVGREQVREARANGTDVVKTRSMMVTPHVSALTVHKRYKYWVDQICADWKSTLCYRRVTRSVRNC